MSRKDYVIIAAALRDARPLLPALINGVPSTAELSVWAQWLTTVTLVASTLSIDNPRFDLDRFLTAAGVRP